MKKYRRNLTNYICSHKESSSLLVYPEIDNEPPSSHTHDNKSPHGQSQSRRKSYIENIEQNNDVYCFKIRSENIRTSKQLKFEAKKGLLYLLNCLSSNKFCPEINEYYDNLKQLKKEEIQNEINHNLKKDEIMEYYEKDVEEEIKGETYANLLNKIGGNQNNEYYIKQEDDNNNNYWNNCKNKYGLQKKGSENEQNEPYKCGITPTIKIYKNFKNDYSQKEIEHIYSAVDRRKSGKGSGNKKLEKVNDQKQREKYEDIN